MVIQPNHRSENINLPIDDLQISIRLASFESWIQESRLCRRQTNQCLPFHFLITCNHITPMADPNIQITRQWKYFLFFFFFDLILHYIIFLFLHIFFLSKILTIQFKLNKHPLPSSSSPDSCPLHYPTGKLFWVLRFVLPLATLGWLAEPWCYRDNIGGILDSSPHPTIIEFCDYCIRWYPPEGQNFFQSLCQSFEALNVYILDYPRAFEVGRPQSYWKDKKISTDFFLLSMRFVPALS